MEFGFERSVVECTPHLCTLDWTPTLIRLPTNPTSSETLLLFSQVSSFCYFWFWFWFLLLFFGFEWEEFVEREGGSGVEEVSGSWESSGRAVCGVLGDWEWDGRIFRSQRHNVLRDELLWRLDGAGHAG
jgi:hypothetical protein